MKVTFVSPLHGGLYYGGAEVQAEMTGAMLQKLGVQVEYLCPQTRAIGDLVHAFGPYESFGPVQRYCRLHQVPFVLSTISYKHYQSPLGVLRDLIRTVRHRHPMRTRKHLFHSADLLLPNTEAERDYCMKVFGADPRKLLVIPNGVERRFQHGDPQLFRERFGIHEPFVLNVGRVENRKNQLRLIKALRGSGIRLVIIGKPVNESYTRQCREAADGNVTFLPPLPHDEPLLQSAYAAARVFAMPSLLETPGIAALEAALAGARIVITPIGGPREYFGDAARYVDPHSVDDIRNAVVAAWEDQSYRAEKLQTRVREEYSWESVAAKTLSAYESVLRGR